MTPDERQLLSGLFDRISGAANQPRDREAESFIADRVRTQPFAPYLLSQTVIVQEQALKAAAERIQQLEAQVQQGGGQQPQEETSFLGSIGKSIFGSAAGAGAARQSVPPTGAWRGQQQDPGAYQQQGGGYQQGGAPGGPWGQGGGGFANAAPQGGGFLKGALGAAAGVAGGVLAADALRGLFGGHNNPFGIASGGGLGAGGVGQPGGETIVNNYYGDDASNAAGGGSDVAADDARQDFLQDQSDDFAADDSSGGDDSSWT